MDMVQQNFSSSSSLFLSRSRSRCNKTLANMGKVHGSLARAGKVRGQTPKMEQTNLSRKPYGRARKRMLYNCRFVTAVVEFGRKRGPNSAEKPTSSK